MDIKIIKNEVEYEAAMARLLAMIEANPESSGEAGDEIELLAMVIENYEKIHWPVPKADPVEVIKFTMEQRGLKVKDIAPCFGSSSRAYEVLNGRRNLTLPMIRKLTLMFHIPAEALLGA